MRRDDCVSFGDLAIKEYAYLEREKEEEKSWVCPGQYFSLPVAEGSELSSLNGGEFYFILRHFEVYSVSVSITIYIIFSYLNEISDSERLPHLF